MEPWRQSLERWKAAGLIDQAAADRIAAFEDQSSAEPASGVQTGANQDWPVLIALIFGGIAMGAGILLLIASHWDALRPLTRFGAVIAMVIVLHMGAIVAGDSPRFRSTFHLLGSIAFGAAIFLTAQIFQLTAHWGHGMTLWFAGTLFAWWLLRDAAQFILLAILLPVAFAGEVSNFVSSVDWMGRWYAAWATLVAITYMASAHGSTETPNQRVLVWVGAVGLIPSAAFLGFTQMSVPALPILLAGALTMAIAWWIRRQDSWVHLLFIFWVITVALIPHPARAGQSDMLVFLLYAAASAGLVWWGLRELRPERVNFGIAGFAITVLSFYLSNVFDRVGRSESLIGLGALLLAGGWFLERTRRRLVADL